MQSRCEVSMVYLAQTTHRNSCSATYPSRTSKQVHDARVHTGLQHGADAIVSAIRQVAERPYSIRAHLFVSMAEQPDQCWQGGLDAREWWARLAPHHVRERPAAIPQQRHGCRPVQHPTKPFNRVAVQTQRLTRRAVPCNIAKRPACLLPDVVGVAAQQLAKQRHRALFHDSRGVLACPRRDIGHSPGRLKLHDGVIPPPQHLHQGRHNTRVDALLNGRLNLNRQ
mmetsp:Transcript_5110/g.18407  ORF Transcript_5110/g.18407 Transcript_5110/m.18407 type:complete len:225 (+) Transcript_5110:2568-3242(+)